MSRRKEDNDAAVRITTAASGASADISRRQRRYIVSMTIRTLCFIGAVAVGPGILRWVLVAAALLLPYFAVVMANAGESRTDGFDLPTGPPGHELPAPPKGP